MILTDNCLAFLCTSCEGLNRIGYDVGFFYLIPAEKIPNLRKENNIIILTGGLQRMWYGI